ncbi:hypothetical protein [Streptomyces phage phiScoe44]|nr:hypothetical protein [Streptomyces phage phiScoe44]
MLPSRARHALISPPLGMPDDQGDQGPEISPQNGSQSREDERSGPEIRAQRQPLTSQDRRGLDTSREDV